MNTTILRQIEPTIVNPHPHVLQPTSTRTMPQKLNLGCSDEQVHGYLNVDRWTPPWATADNFLKVDLEKDWPWEDSSIQYIQAHDVIEHLADKMHTMNEIHRVLKPGGRVEIIVPTTEGRGAWQDPTHVSYWNRNSFLYWTEGDLHYERFKAAYGMKGCFKVVNERHAVYQADGVVKLEITLEVRK